MIYHDYVHAYATYFRIATSCSCNKAPLALNRCEYAISLHSSAMFNNVFL